MDHSSKEICFFGIYDQTYSHIVMLKKGFEECGYRVTECVVDPRVFLGVRKYTELWHQVKLLKASRKKVGKNLKGEVLEETREFDYVLVCFPGQTVMWLAKVLFPRENIIFDAFVSLYDSNVFDRKKYKAGSIGAMRDWILDWYSTHLAWRVLLDTEEHITYFEKMFSLPRKKCIRVFVGSNEKIFYPHVLDDSLSNQLFRVHFHGTYIPLQGITYIINAARILKNENVMFKIIGGNSSNVYVRQIRENAKDLVSSGTMEFVDALPPASLAAEMSAAHVCLGIFGDTAKTQRVIPNKVYEALAMGKLIITADTPAARELLSEETAVLVPAASGEALAAAILALRDDPQRRERLGEAGAKLFSTQLTPKKIVGDLLEKITVSA